MRGTKDLPSFLRRAAGPGWVLVGDAGHHKDPLIARGITEAFRDAETVADALARHWDGSDPDVDSALALNAAHRDRNVRPLAQVNHDLALLDQPTDTLVRRWQDAALLEHHLDAVPHG